MLLSARAHGEAIDHAILYGTAGANVVLLDDAGTNNGDVGLMHMMLLLLSLVLATLHLDISDCSFIDCKKH